MKKRPFLVLVLSLVLAMPGCQSAPEPVDATLPAAPSPVVVSPVPGSARPATPTFQMLGSVTLSQSGKSPDFSTKVTRPVRNGSDNPHAVAFNKYISALVEKQVDGFKKSLLELTPVAFAPESSFQIKYTLVSETANFISLQLKMDQYTSGAAHPFQSSMSVNYDLAHDRQIELGELFTTGSNYLQTIANYSKDTLSKTDLGPALFTDGLAPTADNYRNWNISAEGLMITFDEYQVAPYAAGPQIVVVPYDLLKSMIAPQGALADYAH